MIHCIIFSSNMKNVSCKDILFLNWGLCREGDILKLAICCNIIHSIKWASCCSRHELHYKHNLRRLTQYITELKLDHKFTSLLSKPSDSCLSSRVPWISNACVMSFLISQYLHSYNNFGYCCFFLQLMDSILSTHPLGTSLLKKGELQVESRNLLTEIVANYMLVNMERLLILCFLPIDINFFICWFSIARCFSLS